ncbi:MAG: hypothetical protein OXJ37_08270 [Bryobacterales bacterium]|nr:hypothetical protein [Bryobacterales bacterium]MDE0621474.1 hypothetical protein [Bryobacterales bacterium]
MTPRRSRAALAGVLLSLFMAGCGVAPPETVLESDEVRQAAERALVSLERWMVCWKGATPEFDGRIGEREYDDATPFGWDADWVEAMKQDIASRQDLDFNGWVKHDGKHLYLAFNITDDIFYGIETERWLPHQDAFAHVIGERERGRPWFGDMIEILIFGRMLEIGEPVTDVTGDGRGIQIIYNLTKSLEGGIGVPGMLPHGPNRTVENWENNKRWILDDIIETRTEIHGLDNRYTVEVRIRLDGGMEVREGEYWTDGMPDTPIGFNLAIGDVDGAEMSPDGLLHHETWWAGKTVRQGSGPRLKLWGALVLTSKAKPHPAP